MGVVSGLMGVVSRDITRVGEPVELSEIEKGSSSGVSPRAKDSYAPSLPPLTRPARSSIYEQQQTKSIQLHTHQHCCSPNLLAATHLLILSRPT